MECGGQAKVKEKGRMGPWKSSNMATTLAAIRVTRGALKILVPRPYSTSILIFKSSAGDFRVQPRLRLKAQYHQFIEGETSAREQVTLGDY